MARKSRQGEFPITRTCASSGRGVIAVILAGLLSLALPAIAADTSLRPYTAEYKTSYLGMNITLKRELKTDGTGRYTLTNGGKILVAGFHEVAVFRVEEGQFMPRSYVYQGTGLINRRREVHFTPGSETVRSLYKGKWYELPNKEGTLDRLSQQEHLRLLMLKDPDPREGVSFTVADGRKVKDYDLEYRGEAILETALGPVETLHFERLHDDPERKSDIWLAPAWDYLMVKTVHVEDDKPVEVVLTSASIEGEPVTSNATLADSD